MSLPTLLLFLAIVQPALAVDPLSPEEEQAFYRGAHSYFACIDCHGDTTVSAIARNRIPEVCGDCHPKALENYTQSVHWGEGKAYTVCIDCHGVHGILPVKNPESKAFRSLVCGSCHIGPMEHFRTGPHFEAFEAKGVLACAACHSNHLVRSPSLDEVEPACETCHPRDSAAFTFGQQVKTDFASVEDRLGQASEALTIAQNEGLDVQRASLFVLAGRAAFAQARLIWHGLDGARIREQTDASRTEANRTIAAVLEIRQVRSTREKWLVFIWVIIILNVAMLALKKRRADTRAE